MSYETIRRWIEQFEPVFYKGIKARSPNLTTVWHLDEVFTKINGKVIYFWRAVDVEDRKNNRAENSHLSIRRRERKSQKISSIKAAQKQLSSYGRIYNLFNYQRHLISRKTLRQFRTEAQFEWNIVVNAVMG